MRRGWPAASGVWALMKTKCEAGSAPVFSPQAGAGAPLANGTSEGAPQAPGWGGRAGGAVGEGRGRAGRGGGSQ